MQLSFVLFLDENLHNCRPILDVLERAEVVCERHKNHFAPGTADEIWLSFIGDRQWALLTTDMRIRTRHLERNAMHLHAVRMFCFTGKAAGAATMASALEAALPKMRALVSAQTAPFIATITKAGEVHLRDTFGSNR